MLDNTRIIGIIPSRYASTRFPGKALVNINGKSMVQMVFEQAKRSSLLCDVIVATDNKEIYKHVLSFGGKVLMTNEQHQSGTDRCNEVIDQIAIDSNFDYVMNIQGDEPFIQPEQIDLLASSIDKDIQIATLAIEIKNEEELFNPNCPKVLIDIHENAIYFSRTALPYLRGVEQNQWLKHHTFYRHIGIYVYHRNILNELTKLETSSLEQAESLEQLRWIQNGFKIKVQKTTLESYGIDTPEDLKRIINLNLR